MLSQIRDYVLPKSALGRPRKIIITEDTPVVTYFYERVLNHMHIPTRVLATYLNAKSKKRW